MNAELLGMKERLHAFEALACQADLVVVTIICCDSRVVLPDTLQQISGKSVLFIPIPTIGSGAPSRSRLRGVIGEIRSWGVEPTNIRLLVTQHGDTQEVSGDHSHLSCGLRKFFNDNKDSLRQLRGLLIPWSATYKRRRDDITLAPDRLSLETLRAEAPKIMSLVDTLYEQTGIPRRLLIRAAYRNSDFDIEANKVGVFKRLCEYLADPEYAEIAQTCQVGIAHYDHQRKQLIMHNPDADLGFPSVVKLPEMTPRTDSHQNPECVVVLFGKRTIPHPVSTILPKHCGVQVPDNAFRTVASIPTVPTLLCAMAESAYAILHHNHPHDGDPNFRGLRKLIIVCDDDTYADIVRKMMQDREFLEEYLLMLKVLQPEGIEVVNLQLGRDIPSTKEVISY